MAANFIDDLDVVDPDTVENSGPAYPVAQWLNGEPKLAAAGGVAHTGGIILPEKYVPGDFAPPPGWVHATVAFNNGKTETVLASQKPRLAVVRTRFRWFVVYNGVTTFYPRSGYVANAGMRGHVQALCGIKGFDFPVVVTFKGKASQAFELLLRDFNQKTTEAAGRLVKGKGPKSPVGLPTSLRFPRFAFYLRLAAGPHVKVGQKGQESIVTPPVQDLPEVISEDYLGKSYVGRDTLLELQQVYHDSAEWAAAWDQAGAEGEMEESEITEDEGGAPVHRPPAPEGEPARSTQGNGRAPAGADRPVDGNGLRAKIQAQRVPSDAATFLDAVNGPTVYWTTVNVYGVDKQIAEDIRKETNGDWRRALAGLDTHTIPF